jgi:hypothetical protein
MTTPIPVPIFHKRKPMKPADVTRFRALLAFQLRAMLLEHGDIAAILKLPTAKHAARYIQSGRRVMIDGVIQTVLP